jgi:hypothetical protein
MKRQLESSVCRIVLLALVPAQTLACDAATARGSNIDAATPPDASFCANGCVQADDTCYAGAVDNHHCGVGGGFQCVDCTTSGRTCLYYSSVDGPTCVCPGTDQSQCSVSGSSSSSSGGLTSEDSGDDATRVEAAAGDSAGGGAGDSSGNAAGDAAAE